MKHRVLLLSWILCGHVGNISPAAIVPQDAEDRNPASNVDLPLRGSTRYLQAVAEEGPPSRLAPPRPAPLWTNAPSEEPTMAMLPPMPSNTGDVPDLPSASQDPCPPSSACPPDSNLMHRLCVVQCVPDARVPRKKLAGWVCGRC
jgi:hypothetical protein